MSTRKQENLSPSFEKKTIDYAKTDLYKWMQEFLNELKQKRKFALRLGRLSNEQLYFLIRHDIVKKLCNGTKKFDELTEQDYFLNIEQKGVDMNDKIVLISGDSDFVPAAKLARREGIDFVLDPLFNHVSEDLLEHIDGLRTCDDAFREKKKI